MAVQAITHTEPCHPPSIVGGIPGNGQYWVWLSTGSLCGHRDGRRAAGTAKDDIRYVFRSFKIVAGCLVGKMGEGRVFLTSKYNIH